MILKEIRIEILIFIDYKPAIRSDPSSRPNPGPWPGKSPARKPLFSIIIPIEILVVVEIP